MRFLNVFAAELLKLRRSKVTWLSFALYAFIAAILGAFMWVMMHPEVAESLGLFGKKAAFAFGGGALDWTAFLTFIVQMGGMGGLVLCSIIVAYVFGREYAEGTAKNILALPVPRSYFILAKALVCALWLGLLSVWLVPVALLTGSVIGLQGFSWSLVFSVTGRLLGAGAMSTCCAMLVAWVAVGTRGYLGSLGFTFFTMVPASLFAHTDWARWVPWCIVGLYTGSMAPAANVGLGSLAVIAATLVIGVALTIRHDVYADNGQ
jgi:ABC-type transport system involved in multi-copper enzyme maturation permease subunit